MLPPRIRQVNRHSCLHARFFWSTGRGRMIRVPYWRIRAVPAWTYDRVGKGSNGSILVERPMQCEARRWALAFASIGMLFGLASPDAPKKSDDLAKYDAKIKPGDRLHWSYLPVKRHAISKVDDAAWVRNPIDAFVLAKLEKKGWKPSPPVEPRAWLRRVHLDVTGLPPTLAEQDAFLKNPTSEAMDAVVKDLLDRPSYGERWGRHWLDVVRFAETSGYERDAIKPNVWRYRDYVIRAFNDDTPYDRFLMEQLAGDELDGEPSSVRNRV
ncbi:MAG: DUF1549 domain-containing protein, partial [Planctomycetes bacterium]|nr:DUF1549 domain-containing protein [Planctomycetota bacterium]